MTPEQSERKVLEMLHWVVRDRADALPPDSPERREMEHLSHKLRVARYIHEKKGPIRIGVFGLFSRGKSMLINALIGCRLMPDSLTPATTAVVEVKHSSHREFVVHFKDGRKVPRRDLDTTKEVHDAVKRFGTRAGSDSGSAEMIFVSWPLEQSSLMRKGYVFVDTPGAKSACAHDGTTDEDTRKALEALEDAHVVLFCLNANYLGDEEERKFCVDHVQWLDPLFVINFRDQYESKISPVDFVTQEMFWVEKRKAIAVSALQALEAREQKPFDKAKWDESSVPELEDRIEAIIEGFDPVHVVPAVLSTLKLYSDKISRPPFPVWENFIAATRTPLYEGGDAVLQQAATFWRK